MRIRTVRRLSLLALLAVVAGSLLFCSPGYVVRAGLEEARILSRRRPIDEVIASPATGTRTRDKLELVRTARTFAAQQLGLDVGDSYTTFARVDSDTLLLVLQASRKDAFQPVTWWFPIVGHVPYKGFFDPEDALKAARKLEREGYDTYVRPSGAFSTLGWFNDPLLSTILDYDSVALASTVIHEVTHNTFYLPSQAAFNESFANFVGDVGAAEMFCGIEGDDGPHCRAARAAWHDAILFGDALQRLVSALDNLYARTDITSARKVADREVIIRRWREGYEREVVPRLERSFRTFARRPINNATLMGVRLYYKDLGLFDRAYRETGAPLKEVVAAMVKAAKSSPDAPYQAIARLAPG